MKPKTTKEISRTIERQKLIIKNTKIDIKKEIRENYIVYLQGYARGRLEILKEMTKKNILCDCKDKNCVYYKKEIAELKELLGENE